MSGSVKGKKGKQRTNSKKNANQSQGSMYEGSYGNARVAHTMLSLMGKNCLTKLRNGSEYKGLFHAFSPKMEISLNVAHRLNSEANGVDFPKENELIDEVVYQFENVVSAQFEDVDLEYAVQDVSEANGELGNQTRGPKELELWNGGGDSFKAEAIGGLESSGLDGTNGWDASDMFKANEEKYGVRSDYDSSLSTYTMPLNIEQEKPEDVARATRLANEIESSSDYKQRTELEVDDGFTEEQKYSSVVRDPRDFRKDTRGPRDNRDNDHYGYRDRERGERDRDQVQPPHRGNRDYGDKHRGRGARMRDMQQRHHPGYPGPMGHSRSMGPGGPPGGDRRNQMSMPHMDGAGPQGKFRSTQQAIAPRFSKTGSGGHSREDERMKQNESNAMQSMYPPKSQRQPRMNNRMQNNRAWSNMPPNDYMHPNPVQMHPDSPNVVGIPQNGTGPSLSRTSSSSSNTSMPMQQGHRKHHSTSSQDDQPPHPAHHIRQSSQHSSSSPTGSPMVANVQAPPPRPQPMPGTGPQDPPSASWASIARGKPTPIPTTDVACLHMNQQPPQGLGQSSQVKNLIHVQENATYTYTPSPSNVAYPMANSRVPMQMAPKGHNPPLGAGRGPPQQTILPRQQMQPQAIHPAQNQQQVSQQQNKMQTVAAGEPTKHTQKPEAGKLPKKAVEAPTQSGSKGGERLKELHEFHSNFKLDVNKETANVPHPQSKTTPRQSQPQSSTQQQAHQSNQPHAYQQQHAPVPSRPEHSVPQVVAGPGSPAQILPGQVVVPQQIKHPNVQHQGMVHHTHQITPSPITQIPGASPSIQHFATPSPQSPMQTQPIMTSRMSADKANMLVMQKPMTSPKADGSYAPAPNIHVAVSQVPQTKPSAVFTVSAANSSPVVSSHYQTSANLNAPPPQKSQAHSPGVVAQVNSPTQLMESTSNSAAGDASSTDGLATPGGKPLNPEAREFKPRVLKPAPAARTNTPVPPQQPYVAQGQMMPQMPIVASPQMYPGQLAQIDAMNQPMQIYQPAMFPQPYLQQIQQIPGQQMPQFAFEQSAQVYQGAGPQAMLSGNARVMSSNPQQHVAQYAPDQAQPQVYVPIPQQPSFMPQARPHSAHTPTQVAHVTATSPGSQSIQQPPQAVSHPPAIAQGQHPGGQPPPMWIMNPHLSQQPSVPAQYIATGPPVHMTSAAMTNVTPQQKAQHAPVAYVAQPPPRQYAPYPPSAPST